MIGNPAAYGSGPSNWSDVLSILGASLKDASPGGGGNLTQAQQLIMQRRMAGAQMGAMGKMLGLFDPAAPAASSATALPDTALPDTAMPQVPSSFLPQDGYGPAGDPAGAIGTAVKQMAPDPAPMPPAAAAAPQVPQVAAAAARGPSLSDPNTQRTLAAAAMMGVPGAKEMIDMLDKAKPHVVVGPDGQAYSDNDAGMIGHRFGNPAAVNGWVLDQNDPRNLGQYFGKLPDGVVPNGRGGVANASGLVPAMESQAEATERGKTFGGALHVPNSNGTEDVELGGTYFRGGGSGLQPAQGGGGGAGPTATGGPGVIHGRTQAPADKTYQDENAKAAAGVYAGMQKAAQAAPNSIARLQQMRSLLKGFEGGKYAPAMMDMTSAANSLGFKMDPKWSNAQAAQALQAQMTLELMKNPDTGGSMFPRITNFEMQQFQKAVPGLMTSSAGRDKLVAMYSAVQQRSADVGRMAYKWNQRFGRIDAPDASGRSFQDYLDGWSTKHPLFGQAAR